MESESRTVDAHAVRIIDDQTWTKAQAVKAARIAPAPLARAAAAALWSFALWILRRRHVVERHVAAATLNVPRERFVQERT
jgi:hypothetical protein